jgi:c(7)-type cytochrome triheme protein
MTSRLARARSLAAASLSRLTFWGAVGGALVALGMASGIQRFLLGLGATTNLTDRFPWGFWIGFDFLGIGIAAAGFTIVATVHLLHIERLEPVVRPALLTAFLGYVAVVLVLVVDLGRWDRFWHPLVMWNPHSVMFEITWCVILYSTVLLLEFAPVVLERFRLRAPLRLLRNVSLPIMIAGVILSTLHQSSFGSLYLAVPGRLHALWYTPWLPALFFISCLAAGIAMVLFECHVLARYTTFQLAPDVASDLGKAVAVILAVYGAVRIQDLVARDALVLAFRPDYHAALFWLEFLLAVAIPVGLFLVPAVRASRRMTFAAALIVLMGFAANRMNTVVTGLESWPMQTYFPSVQEVLIGLGIAALGFLTFVAVTGTLEIVPGGHGRPSPEPTPAGVRHGLSLLAGGAVVVMVGFAVIAFDGSRARILPTAEAAGIARPDVGRALGSFRIPPDVKVAASSSDSPGSVTFRHSSHVDASDPACLSCHQERFSLLPRKGLPSKEAVDWHGATRCGACHNGREASDWQADCTACHQSP